MFESHYTTIGILLLILIRLEFNNAFNIEPVKLELFDDKFRVSIPNDPDIKWVAFNININKPFQSFESGQLSGLVNIPREQRWTHEFQRSLHDNDVVYIWLAIQHNKVVFRDKQDPISIGAIRTGNPNFMVPSSSSSTTTTSTTSTTTPSTPIDTRLGSGKPEAQPVLTNKACYASVTEVQSTENKHCKGDILFDENFSELSPERWTNEVRIPINSEDAEFVLYNGTATVDNGILKIPASLYQGSSLTMGTIDLGKRCTSFIIPECSLTAKKNFYLPPIVSGRINNQKSFNFKYGRIEIRAKLPIGDWLVPLIILEPTRRKYGGPHFKNGEIRIAFSRGNQQLRSDNVNIGGTRLYGGVVLSEQSDLRHQFMANVTLDEVDGNEEHFGNQFHLYSLIWKPNELLLSVDGFQYGKIRTDFKNTVSDAAWRLGADDAPLDQMYYVTLGLSAGGHGDFPTNSENKPWENTSPIASLRFNEQREFWHPSWQSPSLEVDFIRIYAI